MTTKPDTVESNTVYGGERGGSPDPTARLNEALAAWISHVADLLDASIASERLEAGLHLVREFRATTGQLEARLVDLEGHLLEAIRARTGLKPKT